VHKFPFSANGRRGGGVTFFATVDEFDESELFFLISKGESKQAACSTGMANAAQSSTRASRVRV
jgi:hypothetical protein